MVGFPSISAFTGVLISGLIIIAILSIIGGVFQFEGAPPAEPQKTITKSLSFEFSVSKLRESRDFELRDITLINGLLFGANMLRYNVSLPNETEEVRLSFDVTRTNRYGPLTIRTEGFSESKRLPKGHYVYDIPVGKALLLTIQPESSWWRIWAPALYDLNNTKIAVSAFRSASDDYNFSLAAELSGLESASLILNPDKGVGTMSVELNGKEIHNGAVRGIETIPINVSLLAAANVISFRAAKNSEYSGKGTLIINYKPTEARPFDPVRRIIYDP